VHELHTAQSRVHKRKTVALTKSVLALCQVLRNAITKLFRQKDLQDLSIYGQKNTTEIEGKDFAENMNDKAIEREYIGRCPCLCAVVFMDPLQASSAPKEEERGQCIY
jgi:hypothetical protein